MSSSSASPLPYGDTGSSASASRHHSEGSTGQLWSGRRPADIDSKYQPNTRLRWDSERQSAQSMGPLIGSRDRSSGTRSPIDTTGEHQEQGQELTLGAHSTAHATKQWTEITSNAAFVNHVMTLYFCWEYPTFASLNKEHFLEDYHAGTQRYCSSLLVNAILALGCRFTNQPEARTDPHNSTTAGNHFFAESVRLLGLEEDKHALTTIQALGLMALREASCGRTSESYYYAGQSIRLAIEVGLHRDTQEDTSRAAEIDHEVRSATFWGAFSLDQCVHSVVTLI